MVYEPREDTYLLLKHASELIKSKTINSILEIGIGSGEIIINLAKLHNLKEIVGTDINPEAIETTKIRAQKEKIKIELRKEKFYKGKKKFDLVLFNPPYLPQDPEVPLDKESKALYGGKKGYETTIRFIELLNKLIKKNGTCLLIISSLSNPEIIYKKLRENILNYKILSKKSFFFEEIYCLEIKKYNFINDIKELKKVKYFSRGKHSTIFEGKLKNKSIIIKVGDEKYIQKEIFFLKKLSNLNFVPKIYYQGEDFVIMEKIQGLPIIEFLQNNSREKILKILNKILNYTQELDQLGINKQEMNHPYKHIIVTNTEKIKFIDFERCRFSEKPKNTTQFLQFISSHQIKKILQSKKILISKDKIKKIGKEIKQHKNKLKTEDIITSS